MKRYFDLAYLCLIFCVYCMGLTFDSSRAVLRLSALTDAYFL